MKDIVIHTICISWIKYSYKYYDNMGISNVQEQFFTIDLSDVGHFNQTKEDTALLE